MMIVCIKIPDNIATDSHSHKFEIGKKYHAYYLPGLGYETSKGYWIDDNTGQRFACSVSKEDFLTLDEFREKQLIELGI